jgi:hypothetical protein
MSEPIPSPLIGGQFKEPKQVSTDFVKSLCEEYEGDSAIFIVLHKNAPPCGKPSCAGIHSDGADYKFTKIDAKIIIEMLMEAYNPYDDHNHEDDTP